jgi:hypothetical protein
VNAGGRGHKYKAIRTECGHCEKPHPSKAEAKRCGELHLLQRAGEIRLLEREPAFPVTVNGIKVFTYKADFAYFTDAGRTIEDVKGVKTPVYKLKKKLVEAYYQGVKIVEISR